MKRTIAIFVIAGLLIGLGYAYAVSAQDIVDTDLDGMDDAWETTHFGDSNQTAEDDFDNDGSSNLEEYEGGSDPTDADDEPSEGFFMDMLDMNNPYTYLVLFFIFCVLAAVILPIPVELGLAGFIPFIQEGGEFLGFTSIFPAFLIVSVVMGLGKGVGSWMVFIIGEKIEDNIRVWFKWKWFVSFTEFLTRFCERFGYVAIYLILSVPIVPDTIPLYIFSLLNKDGEVFEMKWFVQANFWAGLSRGLIVGIAAMYTVNNMAMTLESLIIVSLIITGAIIGIILYFTKQANDKDAKTETQATDE